MTGLKAGSNRKIMLDRISSAKARLQAACPKLLTELPIWSRSINPLSTLSVTPSNFLTSFPLMPSTLGPTGFVADPAFSVAISRLRTINAARPEGSPPMALPVPARPPDVRVSSRITTTNEEEKEIWMYSNRRMTSPMSFSNELDMQPVNMTNPNNKKPKISLYRVKVNMKNKPPTIVEYERKGELSDVEVQKNCLLFVHGNANSAESAVLAGIQQTQDKIADQVIVFSWPTMADWYDYFHNEEILNQCGDNIKESMKAVMDKSQGTVHFLFHSMGNRLGLYAAGMLIHENCEAFLARAGYIFCAAADVDFRNYVEVMHNIGIVCPGAVMNYVSDGDKALDLSGYIHNDYRGGDYNAKWLWWPASVSSDSEYCTVLWRDQVNGTSEVGHEYYLLRTAVRDFKYVIDNDFKNDKDDDRDGKRGIIASGLPHVYWLK
jgi:hypothetical protein